MGILERRAVLYRVQCDICGAWAPEAEDREQALLWAEGQGFELYSRMGGLDGQELLIKALCEGCSSEGLWVKGGKVGAMERISPEKLARLLQARAEGYQVDGRQDAISALLFSCRALATAMEEWAEDDLSETNRQARLALLQEARAAMAMAEQFGQQEPG